MVRGILAGLVWLLPWWGDRHEPTEARALRLEPVAAAVAAVSSDPAEQADLVVVAWDEAKLASYVTAGRCGDGRHRCSGGAAIGPWQVERWCREAWALPQDSTEGFAAQARCALRRLRYSRAACRKHGRAGALAGYRGARPDCSRPGGATLARIAAGVERRIRSGGES